MSKLIGMYWSLRSINRFKERHWTLTEKVESDGEIRELLRRYDAVIIGSDQIWNSACIPAMGLFYFGIHTDASKTKLIAYAPSFGHDRFEADSDIINRIKGILSSYSAISVREYNGLSILSDCFDVKNAIQVLDPTLLMDDTYYLSLAKARTEKETDTLAYYLLDPTDEKINAVKALANRMRLKPVNTYLWTDCPIPVIKKMLRLRYPTVESWIRRLSQSKFVVTDSYHGTVFSIIFHKEFFTLDNKKRGNIRFQSFFDMLDIRDRLLSSVAEFSRDCKALDYSAIDEKLATYRQKSLNYLRQALLQ